MIAAKCNGVKVKSMHYYFNFSKVQIRKNVLKYSNEVKIFSYIPPLPPSPSFMWRKASLNGDERSNIPFVVKKQRLL